MWLPALAVFSGLCSAMVGVAYGAGQSRRIMPMHIALGMVVFGTLVFGVMSRNIALADVPGRVWVLAATAATGQYVTLRLVRWGLELGPLSPVWCAVMVAFVPSTLYAGTVLGERVGWMQYAGVAAWPACVLVGSFQKKGPSVPGGVRGSVLLYGAVLVSITLFCCLNLVAIKDLNTRLIDGQSYFERYGMVYLLFLYVGMGVFIVPDLILSRATRVPVRWWLGLGLVGGVGSALCLLALSVAAQMPAATAFTMMNITSIIASSLASIVFFGERVTRAWYAMVALGLLAVALVNGGAGP